MDKENHILVKSDDGLSSEEVKRPLTPALPSNSGGANKNLTVKRGDWIKVVHPSIIGKLLPEYLDAFSYDEYFYQDYLLKWGA